MIKPLMLLVDDDRTVLEALDAALRPAFEEICRIETFDHPEDVLAALPRWIEERRPIAVAIVDQQMPGITGIELLRQLRRSRLDNDSSQFHPAHLLQSILLTGHAALESAVVGKNESEIGRYVEKPWRHAELSKSVTILLKRWADCSEAGPYAEIREVSTEEDVEALLRIRHEVYFGSRLASLLPVIDTEGIDISPYDLVARHIGLTLHEPTGSRWIGGLRVTGTSESPAKDALLSIGMRHAGVTSVLNHPRREPLPIMNDFPFLRALWDRLAHVPEDAVEPGKLVLRATHRESSVTGHRRLARFLVQATVSFFFYFFRIPNAILGCSTSHVAFYGPFGFRNVDGHEPGPHPRVPFDFAILHGRADCVPAPQRDRCQAIAVRITRTGAACHCLSYPDCIGEPLPATGTRTPSPYETGDFRDTDIFCPMRARELLSLRD